MTAAPPSPGICSAISTSCRAITASCSRAIRPAPRRLPAVDYSAGPDDPRLLEHLAALGFKKPIMVAQTVQQWMVGDYRVFRTESTRNAFVEFVPALIDGPRRRRGARRRGDGLRPLPAGVAARRTADFAAQPEPRPRRAGGADPRRRAAARRHAGAAAADHGRADRSALLRRDAGPARIVRAAGGDPDGCAIPTRSSSTGCGCSARKACS